jgi:TraG-like protein, N-terminal region
MRNRKIGFVILLLLLLIVPASAWATTMEYRVYSGFDAIYNAFNKISLIFNSFQYQALWMGIAGFGAAATLISAGFGALKGKISYGGAAAGYLMGVILFSTMFVPRGGGSIIQLFDPIRNQQKQVGGLPEGIVLLAGTLNVIEMSVVDFIVNTSDSAIYSWGGAQAHVNASSLSYAKNPGGMAFTLLEAATGNSVMGKPLKQTISPTFNTTLQNYIIDCYYPTASLAGSTINIEAVRNSSTDLIAELAKGADPLGTTTVVDGNDNKSGVEYYCSDVWNGTAVNGVNPGEWDISESDTSYNVGIYSQLDALYNYPVDENNPMIRNICGAAGFDVNDNSAITNCNDLLVNIMKQVNKGNNGALTSGGGVNGSSAVMQANIALKLKGMDGVASTQAVMLQNRAMMSSGFGAMMGDWLPIGKAVMTAVAICLMPILVLFLLTPAWPKALGTIAGFFVWISAWGMTDALTHTIALDYTLSFIDGLIQHGGNGIDDLMVLPDASAKAAAMFGMVRGSGAALATMLAGLVTAFGGHALGGIAGGTVSQVQSSGTSAMGTTTSHEGRMQIQQQGGSAGAIMAMPGGYENAYSASAWNESNRISSGAYSFNKRGGFAGAIESGVTDAQKSWDGQESFKGGMEGAGGFSNLLKQDHRQGFQDKAMTGQKVDFNDKVHNEIKGDMINSTIRDGAFQHTEQLLAAGKDNATKDQAIKAGKDSYNSAYGKAIGEGKDQQTAERMAETAGQKAYVGAIEQSGLFKGQRDQLKQDYEQNKDGMKDKINSNAESAAWQFQAIGGSSMKPGEAYSNYKGLKEADGDNFNAYSATQKILDQHAGQAGGKELALNNAIAATGIDIPTSRWAAIQNSGGSATWIDKDGRTHTARQTSILGSDGKPTGSELDLTTKGVGGTESRKSMRMDTEGNITQTAVAETKHGSAVKLGSMQQADGKTEITDVGKELVTGSITEGRSAMANAIATQSLAKTTGNTEQWSEALKAGLSSTKSSEFSNNLNWATSDGLKTMESRNTDMSDSVKKAASTVMALSGKAGVGLSAGTGPGGLGAKGDISGNLSSEERRQFEHAVSVINKDSVSSGHDWGKTVSDSYSEATKKAWSKTFSADDTKQIAHQIGVSDVDQINNAKQIANKLDMNITGTEAQVAYMKGLNHEAPGGDHKFASKPASPERVEEIASWVSKNPGQHKSEFQNFLQDISGLGEVASLKTILNDTKPAVDYKSHASGETQGVQTLGEKIHGKVETAVTPVMKEVAPARTAGGVKPVNKNHFLKNNPTDIASAKPAIAQNNAAKAAQRMEDSSTWSKPEKVQLTDTNPGDNKNSTFFSTVSNSAKVPKKGPAPKDSKGNTLGPAYSTLGGPSPTQYNVTNPGGWSAPGVGYGANNAAPKKK